MKKNSILLACLLIALMPLIYLLFTWNNLPETIPTHWGISGKPDAYGSRTTIIFLPVLFVALITGLTLLILNIEKIDPKKGRQMSVAIRNKLVLSVSLFLSTLASYLLYITESKTHEMGNFFFLVIGLFFAFLGNILYAVRQNFFVGVRLPWTLSDEGNWNRTNRLTGILFFASGIVIAVASLLLPTRPLLIITLTAILGSSVYAIFFSYTLFRKQQKSST